MKTEKDIREKIRQLKVNQAMLFSPIDELLIEHDIKLLEWVMENAE